MKTAVTEYPSKSKSPTEIKIYKQKIYNYEIDERFCCTVALEKGNEQRERRMELPRRH